MVQTKRKSPPALFVRPFDEELLREARIAAIRAGKTMRDWVEDAVREKLERGG